MVSRIVLGLQWTSRFTLLFQEFLAIVACSMDGRRILGASMISSTPSSVSNFAVVSVSSMNWLLRGC